MDIRKLAGYCTQIAGNCYEFYQESLLLFEKKSFARSYALAHFAFEEYAKLMVLSYFALDLYSGRTIKEDEIKKFFNGKLFRDHKAKLMIAFTRLPGFDYNRSISTAVRLNELKNKSLYVEVGKDGEMRKPSEFFDKVWAEKMIELTRTSLQKEVTEMGFANLESLGNAEPDVYVTHFEKSRLQYISDLNGKKPPKGVSYVDEIRKTIGDPKKFNRLKEIVESLED